MNNDKTKAVLQSYLYNLVGVTLGLIVAIMTSSGLESPFSFGAGEWIAVANGIWAAAIPTVIRWLDKQDPAFGRIAEAVAKEISSKLAEAEKAAKKAAATKPKTTTAAKKTTTAKK